MTTSELNEWHANAMAALREKRNLTRRQYDDARKRIDQTYKDAMHALSRSIGFSSRNQLDADPLKLEDDPEL
jgi:hypothetical protein